MSSPESASSKCEVYDININNMNTRCLKCSINHYCTYYNQKYLIPIDLFVPNSFPYMDPILYIRPPAGSKVVPVPNVVDAEGRIIYILVSNLKNITLSQFFSSLDSCFATCFPICNDPIPQLINQCSELLYPRFAAKFDESKQKAAEAKSLLSSIEKQTEVCDGVLETLRSSVATLQTQNKQLKEKHDTVAKTYGELQREGDARSDDLRNAFVFGSPNQRMLMELTAAEKTHTDMHSFFASTLSMGNVNEMVDIIRENGRQLFHARYLKDVVNTRFSSAANMPSVKRIMPQVPRL